MLILSNCMENPPCHNHHVGMIGARDKDASEQVGTRRKCLEACKEYLKILEIGGWRDLATNRTKHVI